MASEEIKLVGVFDDQITKNLQKLTKSIDKIGKSFEKFGKRLKPITSDLKKLGKHSDSFNKSLIVQAKGLRGSSRAMHEYKKGARKVVSAMRSIEAQREKIQARQGVTRAEARRQSRGKTKTGGGLPYAPMPMPKAPKPAKVPKAKTPKAAPVPMPKSGGASPQQWGNSAGQSFAASVGSTAIGTTIGMMASQAIMSGLSKIGQLLQAPFQKFSAAFAERISDEMDDIKSAGGLFALDMDLTKESGNERFFKNYNEALRYQEKLNIDMAESAAALPGVTSQYVSTSRQLTDTIQMVMEKDRDKFNAMAARYGADISGGGTDASKNALQTILKKQTEQVVLQSQGQSGGLPMHIAIQQLMGKEAKDGKIGMQAFTNKFRAAFQKNPLLKNFLLRAEAEMAKTEAGSTERLQSIIEVFDAAMPKEVINKMRGSISGMQEALRSGLMDPQAGLFGMSRAVIADTTKTGTQFIDSQGKLLKKNVNDFGEFLYKVGVDLFDAGTAEELGLAADANLKGQELTLKQLKKLGMTVDKNNMIIDSQGNVMGEVSKSTTYLFEQIREIMAGFGPILLEFVGFLPTLFDPFTQMTTALMPLRDVAQTFIAGFNDNIDVLEKEAQAYAASEDAATAGLGTVLKTQSRGRAAIAKVVSFLEESGGISETLAENIFSVVQDTSKAGIKGYDEKISQYIEPLFKQLIESDLARSLSKGFGQIVGGIIRTVYDMVTGLFSMAEGGAANALVDGFKEGFVGMFADIDGGIGGMMQRVNDIVMVVINKIGEVLIGTVIPAAIAGLMQLILGGFKAGPIGALISGGILAGMVTAVTGATTAIIGMAVSAQKAAFSLMTLGAGGVGRTKGRAAVMAKGMLGKGKNLMAAGKEFFLGGVQSLKGTGLLANIQKANPMNGGLARQLATGIGKTLQGAGGAARAGLAAGAKMGAVGGIIKAIIGMFEGKSPLDAISEGLAAAGGSAIGAAIGTIIAPGIGTVIGSIIGGFLGDIPEVVSVFKGTLMGLGQVFTEVFGIVGTIFGDLFGVIGDIVGIFLQLFGVGSEVTDNFDFLNAALIAVKVVLTPLVAVLNLVSFALAAFRLGLAHVNKFIANLNPANVFNQNKQNELDKAIHEAGQSMDAVAQRQKDWNDNLLKGVDAKSSETKATNEAADAMANLTEKTSEASAEVAKRHDHVEAGGGMDQATADQINALRAGRLTADSTVGSTAVAPVATPAAPVQSLAPAIAEVEQVASKVSTVGTAAETIPPAIEKLGTAATAASTPLETLPPSVEAAKTGLDTIDGAAKQVVSALSAVEAGLNAAVATAQSAADQVSAALVGAANNAGAAITQAASGLASALSSAASSIRSAASAAGSSGSDDTAKSNYMGSEAYSRSMPLGKAIETEKKHMPSGADLVIANSSETIIPAYAGNAGDGFKGLSFAELESAAGFDRMASYTDQISEIADKTAASFSGGFNGMLGGGSATLNAMEALGHSFGLITTSGYRPGDPGYHGVNRARDLSNGGGETPEMNAAAAKMASEFGSSLTELIYTPMGFSIKNGQKTGLISPSNHYHHIHVAVAEGLAKAAVFQSQKAAESYEKSMMPAGSEPMKVNLASMTANSSEFSGGGNITVGDVNVSVSGVDDPRSIANTVAEEILHALEKATYTEIFTS